MPGRAAVSNRLRLAQGRFIVGAGGVEIANRLVGLPAPTVNTRRWRYPQTFGGDQDTVELLDRCLRGVLQAMRKAHSYEEPAFDVYPLNAVSGGGHEGRVGNFKNPIAPGELAKQVRGILNAGAIQLVGGKDSAISRLAIACGAAGAP